MLLQFLAKTFTMKKVMFSSFNFNLEQEDKFQIEVERREHYLFHRLQIQLRNVLTKPYVDQLDNLSAGQF